MPSLAQRWLEQGKQQGIQQGLQQGLQRGLQDMREMVLDAIEAKFGKPPAKIRKQVLEVSDKEKLKAIHRTVLKAEDIADLERSLCGNKQIDQKD